MNYYDNTAPQGASFWQGGQGQQPQYGTQGGGVGYGGPMPTAYDQTNPAGAANDPFAYTEGSLLTPWQGHFNSGGYGGGYSVPEFQAFNYADINYRPPDVGRFGERYDDPAAFRFADFAGPSDFKAPTAEDMKADPGYQARMDAVSNAQRAGAAHGGMLRTGGYEKGLAQAVGNQASQEYGNVYNRMSGEHDRARKEAESNYGINQGNTKSAFDTNTANRLAAYGTRQKTWADNANVGLQEGQLGWQVASGSWDRNMAKARQGYDDEQQYRNSVASAAASNAAQGYARDLDDYNRSRDEFWTNQDRQYAILDREANRGYQAASQYGNQMMGGYGAQADYAMGGANAQAAGQAGSGQAWGNALTNAGNTAAGLYAYSNMNRPSPTSQPPIGGGRISQIPQQSYGRAFGNLGNSFYGGQPYSGMPNMGNPNARNG
jgi:hypothetical protein